MLGGEESSLYPSIFFIEKWKLWLTLYVDDMVLSGPSENHETFWNALSEHLNFEEPGPVSRVLGRPHEFLGDTIIFNMEDFAEATCQP